MARAPLAQRRLLKDKLAGMVQDMAACLSCGTHAGAGDDHRVTMGSRRRLSGRRRAEVSTCFHSVRLVLCRESDG